MNPQMQMTKPAPTSRGAIEGAASNGAAVKAIRDTFSDERKPGRVVGTTTATGLARSGVDTEGVLSIDHNALRIQPLIQAGWGRVGISYGPYERQNGLAFAVYMLNGHNTAQAENLGETFRDRVARWLIGSEMFRGRQRVIQWLRSGRKARLFRQLRWWWHSAADSPAVELINENLAIGWFPREVPANPLKEGNAFIMHATGPECGELWARSDSRCLRTVRGVQNLPICYVVILRERGAMYYASSVPGANGLGGYPFLRPLAVDASNEETPVYPGFHQSVLGQIGFRLDSRVYEARAEHLQELATWYGTACVADRLRGEGPLADSLAEIGGRWSNAEGQFERSELGAIARGGSSVAVLESAEVLGLVHVLCDVSTPGASAGVVWRYVDANNYWMLTVSDTGCRITVQVDGRWTQVIESGQWRLQPDTAQSIQVLDDGCRIGAYLQGQLLFDTWIDDKRLEHGRAAGICGSGAGISLHSFEAHARSIPIPAALDMGPPWIRKGSEVIVEDNFDGPAGELSGRPTPMGGKTWGKLLGAGAMDLTGEGSLKIRASVSNPNPGRTAYSIDWDHPDFADVEVNITPPGTQRGQREHGLCGFIFWDGPDNYITVNIWVFDTYEGASISCFFHLDGFEDVYDAIWTNVGKRIYFGVPLDLRMTFDGERYMVFINEEPVLYRVLTDVYPNARRFSINRVGLLANWEWGNDTGSAFRRFRARI